MMSITGSVYKGRAAYNIAIYGFAVNIVHSIPMPFSHGDIQSTHVTGHRTGQFSQPPDMGQEFNALTTVTKTRRPLPQAITHQATLISVNLS